LSVDHSFPTAGLVLSSTCAGHCTIREQPISAVNKEAAAELCDIDFYFNFCTGTAVDVGHVACTVGERERDNCSDNFKDRDVIGPIWHWSY